ncbi:MAG: hypothetical protein IIX55_09490, partial [Muribaculaceae bacterium]|nr:hypothetical protein [Muribaculaceae bacterium]
MKKFRFLAAIAACAILSSCATFSNPVAVTTNKFGSKCGEASSMIYLGLWSHKGAENGIDKAAKEAGIDYKEFTVTAATELQSVVESMKGQVEVCWLPTDNT